MCIFILYDDTRIVGVHCTKQSADIIVGALPLMLHMTMENIRGGF